MIGALIMLAKLAAKAAKAANKEDSKESRRDRRGNKDDEKEGNSMDEKSLLRNALDRAKGKKEGADMEIEGNLEGLFDGLEGMFGGRAERKANRSGKGRNAGTRRFRKEKGRNGQPDRKVPLSSDELRQEAGLSKPAQRYDDGDVFQAWSGNKDFWVRTGTEVFMGMDDAVTSIAAGVIGTFEAAPNKEFELQGLRIQHNGDGATALATVAIHQTLLAHVAFSYINVGDDKMITGANYVGACTLQDRETEGGDLAGFIVTPTQKLSLGVLNAAAYPAPVFITALGELVVQYGL